MSAKLMGQVYDLDLPHNKAWVLMAMVDHADHIGRNIYPSLSLIAWKTGYSLKQTRRIVKELVTDGILIEVGSKPGYPKTYRADLSKAPRKPEYVIKTKATQNVPTQNGSVDMPREEQNDSTPSQVPLKAEHEPSLNTNHQKPPNGEFTSLIKAWLDSSKSAQVNPYGNKTNRKQAQALYEMGITADDVSAYCNELLAQPFWSQQGVKFDKVANGIGGWKEARLISNGHTTSVRQSLLTPVPMQPRLGLPSKEDKS